MNVSIDTLRGICFEVYDGGLLVVAGDDGTTVGRDFAVVSRARHLPEEGTGLHRAEQEGAL